MVKGNTVVVEELVGIETQGKGGRYQRSAGLVGTEKAGGAGKVAAPPTVLPTSGTYTATLHVDTALVNSLTIHVPLHFTEDAVSTYVVGQVS